MGGVALTAAIAVGAVGIVTVSVTLAPLVVFGASICLAYNLELFGGVFHNDTWFALAWGVFPALTGYWTNALRLSAAAVLIAVACGVFSIAQRRLSTPARQLRRRTVALSGAQQLTDGRSVELSKPLILAPLEQALRALSLAITLLATGLVATRL